MKCRSFTWLSARHWLNHFVCLELLKSIKMRVTIYCNYWIHWGLDLPVNVYLTAEAPIFSLCVNCPYSCTSFVSPSTKCQTGKGRGKKILYHFEISPWSGNIGRCVLHIFSKCMVQSCKVLYTNGSWVWEYSALHEIVPFDHTILGQGNDFLHILNRAEHNNCT